MSESWFLEISAEIKYSGPFQPASIVISTRGRYRTYYVYHAWYGTVCLPARGTYGTVPSTTRGSTFTVDLPRVVRYRMSTTRLLTWWRVNGKSFPGWATAAQIAFALTPNSASCERVFSLLEEMFGPQQDATLADQLRASIMLAYNKRDVG